MKWLAWVLLAASVILFLIGCFTKVFSPSDPFWFFPVAWWRASVMLALYAIALPLLHRSER